MSGTSPYPSAPAPAAGGCLEGSIAAVTSGAVPVPCGECGGVFTPATDGNPRYCDACLPAVADRLRRTGTPIGTYRYPEAVFGTDDPNVRAVVKTAAAGRSWKGSRAGGKRTGKYRSSLAKLVEILRGTDTARLRYWAGVAMIDPRWCGGTGEGGYWAVASRLVNEQARAELRRRAEAWRAAGLGPFATIEAVRAAGLDEGDQGARLGNGDVGEPRRAA